MMRLMVVFPMMVVAGCAGAPTAVDKAGIRPARFAGGHGSVGDYAPLAALAAKR